MIGGRLETIWTVEIDGAGLVGYGKEKTILIELNTNINGYTFPVEFEPGDDGSRVVLVRYHDKYGNKSEFIPISIEKKATPPKIVKRFVAKNIYNARLDVVLSAQNVGPLYYEFGGDIMNNKWSKGSFLDSTDAFLFVSDRIGAKEISVLIKDAAGNECEPVMFSVRRSKPIGNNWLHIEGFPIWTDEKIITLNIIEQEGVVNGLKIWGDIKNTIKQDYFQSKIDVELTDHDGHKNIRVKRSATGGGVSGMGKTYTYYKPTVYVNGFSNPYNVVVPNIKELASVTIYGCVEEYVKVPYQPYYLCNANQSQVTVNHFFSDGSNLIRSAKVP